MKSIFAVIAVLGVASVIWADAPNPVTFCNDQTVVDTRWGFGLFGEKVVEGRPSGSPDLASKELYEYSSAMRVWTIQEANRYWFSSWRTETIQNHFLTQADALQKAAETQWVAANPAEREYALKLAVMYRKISDLLGLKKLTKSENLEGEVLKALAEVSLAEMALLKGRLNQPKVNPIEKSFIALVLSKQ